MILWMILMDRGDVFSSSPLLAGAVPRSNHRLREVRQVLPALLSDAPPETPTSLAGLRSLSNGTPKHPKRPQMSARNYMYDLEHAYGKKGHLQGLVRILCVEFCVRHTFRTLQEPP